MKHTIYTKQLFSIFLALFSGIILSVGCFRSADSRGQDSIPPSSWEGNDLITVGKSKGADLQPLSKADKAYINNLLSELNKVNNIEQWEKAYLTNFINVLAPTTIANLKKQCPSATEALKYLIKVARWTQSTNTVNFLKKAIEIEKTGYMPEQPKVKIALTQQTRLTDEEREKIEDAIQDPQKDERIMAIIKKLGKQIIIATTLEVDQNSKKLIETQKNCVELYNVHINEALRAIHAHVNKRNLEDAQETSSASNGNREVIQPTTSENQPTRVEIPTTTSENQPTRVEIPTTTSENQLTREWVGNDLVAVSILQDAELQPLSKADKAYINDLLSELNKMNNIEQWGKAYLTNFINVLAPTMIAHLKKQCPSATEALKYLIKVAWWTQSINTVNFLKKAIEIEKTGYMPEQPKVKIALTQQTRLTDEEREKIEDAIQDPQKDERIMAIIKKLSKQIIIATTLEVDRNSKKLIETQKNCVELYNVHINEALRAIHAHVN